MGLNPSSQCAMRRSRCSQRRRTAGNGFAAPLAIGRRDPPRHKPARYRSERPGHKTHAPCKHGDVGSGRLGRFRHLREARQPSRLRPDVHECERRQKRRADGGDFLEGRRCPVAPRSASSDGLQSERTESDSGPGSVVASKPRRSAGELLLARTNLNKSQGPFGLSPHPSSIQSW